MRASQKIYSAPLWRPCTYASRSVVGVVFLHFAKVIYNIRHRGAILGFLRPAFNHQLLEFSCKEQRARTIVN